MTLSDVVVVDEVDVAAVEVLCWLVVVEEGLLVVEGGGVDLGIIRTANAATITITTTATAIQMVLDAIS